MNPAPSMPGYPSGWLLWPARARFRVGRLQAHHFMGHPIALFRTASGRVCATDAYCPHLGVSPWHCGAVVGESLVWVFGFRFAGDGACPGHWLPHAPARRPLGCELGRSSNDMA